MKVYMVWDGDGTGETWPILFATYELADAWMTSRLAEFWTTILDPMKDIPRMGGAQWRVEHYTALGWDAFLDARRQGLGSGPWVEEVEVLDRDGARDLDLSRRPKRERPLGGA